MFPLLFLPYNSLIQKIHQYFANHKSLIHLEHTLILGVRAVFLKVFHPQRKSAVREFFFKFPYKPQDKEGACLKMAAVDMAREEAATQLFMKKNQANGGSLTLQPVARLSRVC